MPEERLDLLRRYIEECINLITQMQQAAQQQAMAAMAPQQAQQAQPAAPTEPSGATPAGMTDEMIMEEAAAAAEGEQAAMPM